MSGSIHSMTGYASLRVDPAEHFSFTLTIKSVNHRFLDLQLRLPANCDALESQIRTKLKEQIQRGHVDMTLQLDRQSRAGLSFNHDQIAAYIQLFREAMQAHGLTADPDLNDVLRLPGMVNGQQAIPRDETGALEAAVMAELPRLLAQFNVVRAQEGIALAAELRAAMLRLDALAEEVSALREGARAANFDRLRVRITELTQGSGLSEERLYAEVALLAERSDIDEELVRLRTHVASCLALLDAAGPLGKRLDFLLQEMNREANTLLSKTGGAASQNGIAITERGLEMKLEIERAREQVQNLE